MHPRLYYTDHYEFPLPPRHKFPLRKYRLLREALERSGTFVFKPAPLADAEAIKRVHDPEYVQAFIAGTLAANVMRRIGFPWSRELVVRTLASVGGTMAAARDALSAGWGGTLAGGTHHALRGEGAGFCVFNDIAVAIASLKPLRATVLDLDVHQGDGTAAIFADDPDVLTISVHGQNNFPFRKQTSKIDVGLTDGAGDGEYLSAVEQVLPQAIGFSPDILFLQAGVDSLASDLLGRLSVTPEGLMNRDRLVFTACRQAGLPCVITLGGGYSDPIELTVEAHTRTFLAAARIFGPATVS